MKWGKFKLFMENFGVTDDVEVSVNMGFDADNVTLETKPPLYEMEVKAQGWIGHECKSHCEQGLQIRLFE